MLPPKFWIPDRYEAMVRMANGSGLQPIVVEPTEGLQVIDELYADMESAGRGAFLVLQGKTGSGKSTLLNTVHLFRKGVATFPIGAQEPIAAALGQLPPFTERLRILVIEGREALASTSSQELEDAIHVINQFIRTREGAHTLVAWPCTTDNIVERLVGLARQIGGSALLGVREDAARYSGPPREQYLLIARRTIEALNAGASLANLGIAEARATQLASEADTIGGFLAKLSTEARRNREALISRLPEKDWFRLWVVVVAGNDPEEEVGVLTRGARFSADIDRLLASTEGNTAQLLRAQPEKLGLLSSLFDTKIIHLPYTTAMAVLRDFADDDLQARLPKLPAGLKDEGLARLRKSDLALALRAEPVGLKKAGAKPESGKEIFEQITRLASKEDGGLNRALGRALVAAGLVRSFQDEASLETPEVRYSDLLCQTDAGPLRLELMWRAQTSRAAIADYLLTKLAYYGRATGILSSL